MRWKIAQSAEILWWKRYLKGKKPTEYLVWKKNYWDNFLAQCQATDIPNDARVLDAGCGPAGIFIVLEQQKTDALDPLLDSYERDLSDFFKKENYPNTHFLNQSLEDFSIENEYDVIFCLNAINHVENLPKALKNLHRSLKKGGVLYLSTDVHRHTWLKKIFRLLPGDILHPQQDDTSDYERLFEGLFEIKNQFPLKKELIFEYVCWKLVKRLSNNPR